MGLFKRQGTICTGASFRNAAIVSVMVPVLRSCPRSLRGNDPAAHEEEVGKLCKTQASKQREQFCAPSVKQSLPKVASPR